MRILVIEDDPVLGEALTTRIKRLGHGVDLAPNGFLAHTMLSDQDYDLILLDLNLPDTTGSDIVQTMRSEKSTTPVLVITARNQVEDRISLLDLGADDYLTKPFDFGELEARMRALLRRSSGQSQDSVEFGDVILDRRTCEVSVNHHHHEMKQREFRLLEIFMSHPKQVLSKEAIMEHIYGYDESPGPNVIEIYVARLRKTLLDSSIQIRTIRGLGYLLEEKHVG